MFLQTVRTQTTGNNTRQLKSTQRNAISSEYRVCKCQPASVHRANVINVEKGADMSVLERTPQAQEQVDELLIEEIKQEPQESKNVEEQIPTELASTSIMPWNTPKVTLRQTGHNCGQVVLNKEEQELIDEFLET